MPYLANNLSRGYSEQPSTAQLFAGIAQQSSLPALIAYFADMIEARGATGHLCLEYRDGKQHILFGDTPLLLSANGLASIRIKEFPVQHWDGQQVRLLVRRGTHLWKEADLSHIALMATSYVHHALTMLDCDDWGDTAILTKLERHCLAYHLAGLSNLDIGHSLDRSVHVIELHLRRATQKMNCRTLTEATAKAAATGQLVGIPISQTAA